MKTIVKNTPPTEAQKLEVVRLFKTTKNNTTIVIANKVGIKKTQADYILACYLKTLTPKI